jgi:tight adherence protein B
VTRPVAVLACLTAAVVSAGRRGRLAMVPFATTRPGWSRPARPWQGVARFFGGTWRSSTTPVFAGAAVVSVLPAAVVAGPLGMVVGAAGVGAAAVARWAYRLGADSRYEAAMVDLVDGLARRLRAGTNLAAALRESIVAVPGPLQDDLDRVHTVLAGGGRLDEALQLWHARRPLPSVGLVAGALAVGAASGGLRAVVVDDLALMLRQRDRARREALALAGQARASAAVMMVAPVVVAVLLAAGDGAVRSFLLGSSAGLGCLAAGLALDLVAAAWMVHITVGAAWLR